MMHVQEGSDGRDASHEGRGIRLYDRTSRHFTVE